MDTEKKNLSRLELLMDAGFGAQKAGDILIRAFAHTGRYVYIEPLIPAEISPPPRTKPALSGAIIRVADFDLTNIGNNTDLILAQHEIVLDRRLDDEETNDHAHLLLDIGDRSSNEDSYEQVCKRVTKLGLRVTTFEIDAATMDIIKSLGGKGRNIYYLGVLSEIYKIPIDVVIKEIKASFGVRLKEEILNINIKLFEAGYQYAQDNIDITFNIAGKSTQQDQILIDGNTSLSMGIIDAGIKLYSGYPITPASSIMHSLAKELPSYGGIVHQAEDEIAAIGAAIGSYFGGVPAVTGTSGPGLSLKQEFIGYASMAEIPIIVIDAQRSGPSTGMPTKTEQSDLPAAIFGCHGDNTKVVISVANVRDCFRAPALARYLAEKLRIAVIIMTDFQTANCYKIIEKPIPNEIDTIEDVPEYVFERFRINPLPDDIEMVRESQDDPGTADGMRRVTGLNTDITGSVNYFAGANQRAHRIRNEKIHHVRRALQVPEMFGPDEGEILAIGWGSTRGVIEEAVTNLSEEGIPACGMCLRIVYPLPLMLKDIFSRFKKVVTVELTYGDPLKPPPLMMMLRSETLYNVDSITCRATGRPIQPKIVYDKLKEELEKLRSKK